MSASRVPIQVNGRTYERVRPSARGGGVRGRLRGPTACHPGWPRAVRCHGWPRCWPAAPPGLADAVVPTFTSPNNLDRHGRAPVGARHLRQLTCRSRDAGVEVTMNDPEHLRAPRRSWPPSPGPARPLAVGHRQGQAPPPAWPRHAECAFQQRRPTRRRARSTACRGRYSSSGGRRRRWHSADLSGVRVRRRGASLRVAAAATSCYLSTTDYVQHKHAPGTPEADAFYRMMDALPRPAGRAGRHDRADRRPRDGTPRPTLRDVAAGASICKISSTRGSGRGRRA